MGRNVGNSPILSSSENESLLKRGITYAESVLYGRTQRFFLSLGNAPAIYDLAMTHTQQSKTTVDQWLADLIPQPTRWNILSLGAGVQSSALALMLATGEVGPAPDAAIFADTQAEPDSVYEWLRWLDSQIQISKCPFPVHIVSAGSLTAESLAVRPKKKGGEYVRNNIPAFGLLPDGRKTAAIGRKCTADFKIKPIIKKVREITGATGRDKTPIVTQFIGISFDEMQRMKMAPHKWLQNRWPLVERRMRRVDCIKWMLERGYPEPPRSACVYCPFHSDTEWRRLRDEEPHEFAKAIAFDKILRETHRVHNKNLRMEVYLHNSCKPLSEIDFDSDEQKGQQVWDFQSECEGMCGI